MFSSGVLELLCACHSTRQCKAKQNAYTSIQGKNNVGAATPGCWRVLEKCTLLQNSKHSGPEVPGKTRENQIAIQIR